MPVILLPGMAADARMFNDQVEAFPNLRVQSWIPPLTGESLKDYAARLAPIVDPGCECLLGGASFGGIVALELAHRLPARACILIGSIRSPSALPWRWRMLRPFGRIGPDRLQSLASTGAWICRWLRFQSIERRLQRLSSPDASFVRWAMCAVLGWHPDQAVRNVKIYQIHGSDDAVFPVERSQADVIIPHGEHALSFLCPAEVNQFLAEVLQRDQQDHK